MDTTFVANNVLGEAGIEALRQLILPKNQSGEFRAVQLKSLQHALHCGGYGNINVPSLCAQLVHYCYATWRDTSSSEDLWGVTITPEGERFLKEWDALTKK